MKLIYRILWFEDDSDIVEITIGPKIISFMESLGFICEFVHKLNGDELDRLVKEGNFDLILTDLNLGQDHETGEKLIGHIREYNVLTEVLLYSATPAAIEEIMQKSGNVIERISFSAGPGNLFEKLKKIISFSVKKVQDVNNMRGLVIAQSIDLENAMEAMVLEYFRVPAGSVLSSPKDAMLKEIYEKKLASQQGIVEIIKKTSPIAIEEMIEKDILTADNTYQAVMSIVKTKIANLNELFAKEAKGPKRDSYATELKTAEKIRDILKDFHKEVLYIRNTLAHVKEEKEADGTPYLESLNKTGATIRFNDSKYSEIRRNLKKHSDNLKEIFSKHLS